MIVVDTSAIVAIFKVEADAQQLAQAIERDPAPVMSAASVMECSIVIRAAKLLADAEAEVWLDEMLGRARIDVRPVTAEQLVIARAAHVRFGKGTGHPAQLNFGDCFAYALAKAMDVPLLYKGDDFARTDIRSAL